MPTEPRLLVSDDGIVTLIGWDLRAVLAVFALYRHIEKLSNRDWHGALLLDIGDDVHIKDTGSSRVKPEDLARHMATNRAEKKPAA